MKLFSTQVYHIDWCAHNLCKGADEESVNRITIAVAKRFVHSIGTGATVQDMSM